MFRVLLLILVVMSSVAFARAGVRPVPAPTSFIKLDEIGKSTDKDFIARFEGVKKELAEEPTINAYVINYGTKSQIQKRVRQIRKAIDFCKIDAKRVFIIFGGNIDGSLKTSIYLVPGSVIPPKPVPNARILDEFGKLGRAQWKKRLANLEAKFIASNDATAQLMIINYGTDKEIASAERLIKEYLGRCCDRFQEARVTIARGGYEKKPRRVFWIIPEGAEPPKP